MRDLATGKISESAASTSAAVARAMAANIRARVHVLDRDREPTPKDLSDYAKR